MSERQVGEHNPCGLRKSIGCWGSKLVSCDFTHLAGDFREFAFSVKLPRRCGVELGLKFGRRRRVNAYTEVVFKGDGQGLRPDGLLTVRSRKTPWSALVEAKIGGQSLAKEQLENYLKLARDNGIDAVVTTSNAFAMAPEHHPVKVSKRLMRKTLLLHWSWASLLTHAKLLLEIEGIDDVDHQDLARELDRFLSHKSTGIKRFEQLPPAWREINAAVADAADLHVRADFGRGRATQAPLADIREDADALFGNAPFDRAPKTFIITLTKGGTFIEDIEALATDFYELIGQRLTAWRPPAPTVRVERSLENVPPNLTDGPPVEAERGRDR